MFEEEQVVTDVVIPLMIEETAAVTVSENNVGKTATTVVAGGGYRECEGWLRIDMRTTTLTWFVLGKAVVL